MAFKLLNRARMSVSGAPGTGAITLNAATSGFQSFASAGLSDGDTVSYVVEDGTSWEIGVGTYTSSGTSLARTTITQTSAGGTSPLPLSSSSIVTATIRSADISGGSTTLNSLTDVNVTEGGGIDGYSLTWNNSTSKWIASAPASGTLAGDSDVSISSPTDGQVLTYNGSASKWENAAPPAGGGASPPSLTTFSEQALASGVTVTTNYVAGNGLTMMRTDNQGSDVAAFQGTTVPGTTPWTVTMQVRQINMGVGYLRTGMGLYDTSSTKGLSLSYNNQSGSPNYGMFTLNSGLSGYANNYGGNSVEQYTPIPEWFQISFDGTTYTGAISWDGGTWFTVGTVTTSTLGWTATHIGMMIETYGGGGSGKGGAVALNYAVT